MRELVREPAQAVLDLQLGRLHSMLSAVLVDAAGGDHNAIASSLKIMEMINKLSGLDKKEETGGGQAPGGVHIKMEFVGLDGPKQVPLFLFATNAELQSIDPLSHPWRAGQGRVFQLI